MPIVAHSSLPTFKKMLQEGDNVLTKERAEKQDIRELHIGLLNMMPDAALEATERQFFKLIGACNKIAQFYIHPFTFPQIKRSDKAQHYINQHYESFENLQNAGLDALIISGANPSFDDLAKEAFWEPLQKTLDWASKNVTSTLCACLATHATVQHFHGITRKRLPQKKWGVFSHRLAGNKPHPLTRNINTRFDVPHSRWNNVSKKQFDLAGIEVLIESEKGGVHLAVSEDGLKFIYFQAHPEYEVNSLLKEYKREVRRYLNDEVSDYPPFPYRYFSTKARKILNQYKEQAIIFKNEHSKFKKLDDFFNLFPEALIGQYIDNTWNDTGKIIINNWLGLVYQLTNSQRHLPFMDGIDPKNPLKDFK